MEKKTTKKETFNNFMTSQGRFFRYLVQRIHENMHEERQTVKHNIKMDEQISGQTKNWNDRQTDSIYAILTNVQK